LLFVVAFRAQAEIKPITINGNIMVCSGVTAIYSISSALTPGIHYKWSISACGKIMDANSLSALQVLWGKPGIATIKLEGRDEKNIVMESGSYLVTIKPTPPAPNALLGPDTVCFEAPITFTAKNTIEGTLFEWATPGGICNFTSGDSTEAAFSGSSPAMLMVWRVNIDAPHCHSD